MTRAAAARRPRARKGEGERLREEILAATERLLIATGDQEAVSVRAIAKEVGVTPPSIYLHFADKADLIFAVCAQHFVALDAAIESAAADVDDPLEELRARGRAYVQFGLDHPEQYRILFMSKPTAVPSAWTPEVMMENAAFNHHLDAVQRAIASGAFPATVDPYVTAIGLWAAAHGVVSLLLAHPDFPWPAIDALVDSVLAAQARGIAAHE